MGMLDFVKREEFSPKQPVGNIDMKCERCGSPFKGHQWMIKAKKAITCPQCWRYDKLDEEEGQARSMK